LANLYQTETGLFNAIRNGFHWHLLFKWLPMNGNTWGSNLAPQVLSMAVGDICPLFLLNKGCRERACAVSNQYSFYHSGCRGELHSPDKWVGFRRMRNRMRMNCKKECVRMRMRNRMRMNSQRWWLFLTMKNSRDWSRLPRSREKRDGCWTRWCWCASI
jgi:hypothetical protein